MKSNNSFPSYFMFSPKEWDEYIELPYYKNSYRENYYIDPGTEKERITMLEEGEFVIRHCRGQAVVYVPKDILTVVGIEEIQRLISQIYKDRAEDFCSLNFWREPAGNYAEMELPPSVQYFEELGRTIFNDVQLIQFIHCLKEQYKKIKEIKLAKIACLIQLVRDRKSEVVPFFL